MSKIEELILWIPAIFPRYGMSNVKYQGVIIEFVRRSMATKLSLWTNPHNDGMCAVYANKIDECADHIRSAAGLGRLLGDAPAKRSWQVNWWEDADPAEEGSNG